MATLKGQNFRILTKTGDNFHCVGMATNCTVTLTGNTDDASTKDDLGGAQKPEITSKSWSVSVESLSVADVATILTAVKNNTKFTLLWDEVATSDNQTPQGTGIARMGDAYLNDVTFQFNDRENASKSLQFTGTGALSKAETAPTITPLTAGAYTKGQFVRLFLGSDNSATPAKVIYAAKSLSLHVSVTMEDATTKDTEGDWQVQEPTGYSFDISSNALIRSNVDNSTFTAQGFYNIEQIYEDAAPVKFQIANVSGAMNRVKGTVLVSGSVIVTQLTVNGPNRQNATYDTTLTGYGEYAVGAAA